MATEFQVSYSNLTNLTDAMSRMQKMHKFSVFDECAFSDNAPPLMHWPVTEAAGVQTLDKTKNFISSQKLKNVLPSSWVPCHVNSLSPNGLY